MLRMVKRSVSLAAATVLGQAAYARLRDLPSFDGLDPSGYFGADHLDPLRIVVLGDSTVTAPGLDNGDETWPRVVARRLADRFRVELECLAVGGAKSRNVMDDQLPRALDRRWHVAIVSVGSNDVLNLVPVWRFERNLDTIVNGLKQVSDSVILFGVGDLGSIPRLPFPLDRAASGAGHVADWVHRRVADRHGVEKIDQWRLTTAAFNSGVHMFAPDLFHPSAVGHRAWADAVMPTLEASLRVSSSAHS